MSNLKLSILALIFLSILVSTVSASNDTLKMPSPVRGWNSAPEEAKTWAQTLLDWGAAVVGVVALASLILYFVKGRVADTTGSIQDRNDSTSKTIGTIVSLILLVVAIGFMWAIFWK